MLCKYLKKNKFVYFFGLFVYFVGLLLVQYCAGDKMEETA